MKARELLRERVRLLDMGCRVLDIADVGDPSATYEHVKLRELLGVLEHGVGFGHDAAASTPGERAAACAYAIELSQVLADDKSEMAIAIRRLMADEILPTVLRAGRWGGR